MFKPAFKKAAAVAVLLSPFALFTGQAQAASDRIPDDPRYKVLSQAFKNAQKDCVLLDKISETKNRKSGEISRIIEVIERLPESRIFMERARNAGVAFCIVTPAQNPEGIYNDLYAFYSPGSKTIVFNEDTPLEGNVSYALHELKHGVQDFDGEFGMNDQNMTFAERIAITLRTETAAFAAQIINTWMLAKDEYTGGHSFPAARAYVTQEQQYAELASHGRAHDAIELRKNNLFFEPLVMLDKMEKDHPDWIANGRAAQEITGYLNKQGMIEEIYTRTAVRKTLHAMIYNLTVAAQKEPDLLTKQKHDTAIWFGRAMVNQGIVNNMSDAVQAAIDLIDAVADRNIISRAAKNPAQVSDGALSFALYEELARKGVIDTICGEIMKARKAAPATPAASIPASKPDSPRIS